MSKILIQSLDPAFFDDRLHFSIIEDPRDTSNRPDVAPRDMKASGVVRLTNGGADPLAVSEITLSGPFSLANPALLAGLTLDPGQSIDVTVLFDRSKYTAPAGAELPFSIDTRAKLDAVSTGFSGALTIRSNDPTQPVAEVDLAGFWQWRNENGLEPNLNEIFQVFGFGNRIPGLSLRGGGQLSVLSNNSLYVPATPDEVMSPYWRIAPGIQTAKLTAIATYRDIFNPGVFGIHAPGANPLDPSPLRRSFFETDRLDNNSVLPNQPGTSQFGSRIFFRSTVPDEWTGDDIFGFRVEYVSSDPRLNPAWDFFKSPSGIGAILVDKSGEKYTVISSTQATRSDGTVVLRNSIDLAQQGHWLKMFQALDAAGRPIPFTYIGTMDYPGLNFDYNDNIFVVEGVEPVGFGAGLVVNRLDRAAADNRLVFTNIDTPDNRQFVLNAGGQQFRNQTTIELYNDGFLDLPITSVEITGAGAGAFQVTGVPSTLAAGARASVTVRFVGTDPGLDGKATPYDAQLVIRSNGNPFATRTIALSGLAQDRSELNEEPTLAEIVRAFGYTTDMGGAAINGGGVVETVGDEILAPYFRRVDPTKPVEVVQIGSFLQILDVARLGFHTPDKSTVTPLLAQDDQQTQTVLPDGLVSRAGDTGAVASASFNPAGVFGLKVAVDGKPSFLSWSDPLANRLEPNLDSVPGLGQGHLIRVFEARGANGQVIPGTYIVAQDYAGAGNFDYNDAVYVIRNVEAAPLGLAYDANRNGVADALENDADRDGLVDFFDFTFDPPRQLAFTPDRTPWRVDADGLVVLGRDFDTGGQGVAYFDTTAARIGSTDVRPGEAVDISLSPQRSVGYIETGEWLEYTVFVEQTGKYDISFIGATPLSGRTLTASFSQNGAVYGSVTATQKVGAWGRFLETDSATIDLQQGEQVIRVTFNQGSQDLLSFEITPFVPAQAAFTPDRTPWRVDADGLTIRSRDYDTGGQGIAYFDTTPGQLGASDVRPGEAVDISLNAQRSIGFIEAGEWVEYTVFVERAGDYNISFNGATPMSGRTLTASFFQNGSVYENVTATQKVGNWGVFQETDNGTVSLRQGEQVIRVTFNQGGQSLESFELTPSGPFQAAFTPDQNPWRLGAAGLDIRGRDFDLGGQGVAYFDTTIARLGSTDVRPGESVDFSTRPERSIGFTEAGEWVEYTIDVQKAGAYKLGLTGATPLSNRTITASFTQAGATYETATFTQPRGDWGLFLDTPTQIVDLEAGVQVVRMRFDNASQDLLSFSLDAVDGLFV